MAEVRAVTPQAADLHATHRIALVAPQSVPAVVGGAENLWAGLIAHFNRLPGVNAELVLLPSPEKTLPEILQTYAAFARLDLSCFDQVISTTHPAWAVCHPNHTVYLQHTLRGLYDTYPQQLDIVLSQSQLEILKFELPPALFDSVTFAARASWQGADRQTVADQCFTELGGIAETAELLLGPVSRRPDLFAAFPGP
ncbi:MAG: hypothetical protein FGM22_10650, partial [Burkholderiaceae bacterium]|nr:hypothetical protein [Burkholderiaceae bacterium]